MWIAVGCGGSAHSKGGSGAGSADDTEGGPTSPAPEGGLVVGALDAAPTSALPPLPSLTNVTAIEREDSVGIDFDPVDDAIDYRVYLLPEDSDVTVNADGSLAIKNAVYRCAGVRQTFDVPNNLQNDLNAPDAGQAYVNKQYSWTVMVPANPTLGYVYVSPTSGSVPVYAVGINPTAPEIGWRETRPKVYTTSATQRQTLLGQGGRDDGIVFYVPSAAGSTTQTIYHSQTATQAGQNWTQYTDYYFTQSDMASHATDSTPPAAAFQVLTGVAAGTKPLMAVFYQAPEQHVELAVGKERFNRAANQGPIGPLWHLEWSGLTQPTTLVVEALASGCPYQGFLSPQSLSAPPHQPFLTLNQIQSASTTGEAYVNGQYDLPGSTPVQYVLPGNVVTDAGPPLLLTPDASPIPIARSFIQVAPQPHNPSDWDWYEGFTAGSSFSAVTPAPDPTSCSCATGAQQEPCSNGEGDCGYWTSADFNIGAYEADDPGNIAVFGYGQFLGQFWDVFDDWSQDVTGSVRFTAPTQSSISSDPTKFLHVTWSVNTVSTDRRYPQLIVTDQGFPIQDGFRNTNGNFILIQPIEGPSMRLEVEAFHGLVNGNPWAVNNQAPDHAFIDYDGWNNGVNSNATYPPSEPPFEHAGMDRMTTYDAYISSGLLYVFMDGTPAGCTQYPNNGFAMSGTVTVTFGDVLYHEGAPDELICAYSKPYGFMHQHQCLETKRHWDDLGFKSGVAAPAWDQTKFPCAAY